MKKNKKKTYFLKKLLNLKNFYQIKYLYQVKNGIKNLNVLFKEGSLQINYEEEVFMTGSVSEIKNINLDI